MPGAVLRLAKQFKSLRRPPGSACRVQGRHARALSTAHADVPSLDLKYAKLGSSDLSVSETFGEQNTEKEAHAQLSFARDAGVNFLDTAELYPVAPRPETQGLTSTYIGTWLKHQQRDKVVVGSKVAGRSVGLDWIPANRSVPRGKAAVEAELRRLQTDYIDLLQIHWPDRYVPLFGRSQYLVENEGADSVPVQEQVAAIRELIEEGKVRHWGLSNETTFGVVKFCAAADALGAPRPITIQNSFSMVHRSFESDLAEA
eukprot:gene9320-11045_t